MYKSFKMKRIKNDKTKTLNKSIKIYYRNIGDDFDTAARNKNYERMMYILKNFENVNEFSSYSFTNCLLTKDYKTAMWIFIKANLCRLDQYVKDIFRHELKKYD